MPDTMTEDDHGHVPVLLDEVLEQLDPNENDVVVDCTAGRGGHAEALAKRLGSAGTLILFDLDPENLNYTDARIRAQTTLEPVCIARSFAAIRRELGERGLKANCVLADLGFASNQIDTPERGLSLRFEGPLDMRLDPSIPIDAEALIAMTDENELIEIIRRYGEDPLARRIARKIIEERSKVPIKTTTHLARIIRESYGSRARDSRVHPATRTFQALRIAVNDELGALEALLNELRHGARRTANGEASWLAPGARLGLIGFHSLEDRMIKQMFVEMDREGSLERRTRKPICPSDSEIGRNARSRSAKLRCATVGAQVS
jgi:16S rRNA (cytosine1402-N4)-methyltransferase